MTDAERKTRQNKHAATFRAKHGDALKAYRRDWCRRKRKAERERLGRKPTATDALV